MKKVSVSAELHYSYEVEVPDDADILCYCDSADPVYSDLCKVLTKEHLNFEGNILSIVDEDTEEFYYD